MKKHRISESVCHLLGTASTSPTSHDGLKRKGLLTSVFLGFGFVLGGSILVLTIISFMSPSISFPQNHLDVYYLKFSFPRWPNSPVRTSSSTISSTSNTQTQMYDDHTENSLNYTSSSMVVPIGRTRGASVVTEDTSILTSSSNNFSSDSNSSSSTKPYNKKQQGNGNEISPSGGGCDVFEGEWVMVNDRKPYYPPGSCPYIQNQATNCYGNGRPDVEYLKWQWQWQAHPANAGCSSKSLP
ncbi:hypothetical protein MKW94_017276, partial [Papaver nudicaule]|nr:hypothetical protein [Papaver nudicaule]